MPKEHPFDTSREQDLAAYWRRKAEVSESDFDLLSASHMQAKLLSNPTLGRIRDDICRRICEGLPLYYMEYHLAIAFGYIISDLPYDEFFKTRWHETRFHRAYGDKCLLCEKEELKASVKE
jgi:hypothetical protein